jgi:hypothetical protein
MFGKWKKCYVIYVSESNEIVFYFVKVSLTFNILHWEFIGTRFLGRYWVCLQRASHIGYGYECSHPEDRVS